MEAVIIQALKGVKEISLEMAAWQTRHPGSPCHLRSGMLGMNTFFTYIMV